MSGYEPEAALAVRVESRRRRAAITLATLALVLFFAFWYAFSYIQASSTPPAAVAAPCVTISPGSIVPSTTKVNVYNATSRSGLAASTARELQARGFVVGAIANDPKKKKVAGPAEVRYGPAGAKRVALVTALIGKGAVTVKDTRKDASIDLVIGNGFTSLTPAPTTPPTPICTPTQSPTSSASASPTTS